MESLLKPIEVIKPEEQYREIGNNIEKHMQNNGYSVVTRNQCFILFYGLISY